MSAHMSAHVSMSHWPMRPTLLQAVFAAESLFIGECDFNSVWFVDGFGTNILQDMMIREISCCGNSYGRNFSYYK